MHSIQSVGMDVSRDTLDVAILRANRSQELAQFVNTPAGIKKLISQLKAKGAQGAPFVCESTGEYHRLACLSLTKARFTVNCINPLVTKKYERSSIRGGKTDRVDAVRLAEIGLLEPNLPVFADTVETIRIQKLTASLAFLEKERQRLHQHRKRLELTKAEVGFRLDARGLDALQKSLDKQIANLRKQCVVQLPENLKQLAKETKGISCEQLGVLFALIGSRTFSSKDKLVAFVGLDVLPRQSGQWQGKARLSKRGNAYARKVLCQMAWGLLLHDDRFKQYFRSLRNRGLDYRTCLVALARKFLRQLYAIHFATKV